MLDPAPTVEFVHITNSGIATVSTVIPTASGNEWALQATVPAAAIPGDRVGFRVVGSTDGESYYSLDLEEVDRERDIRSKVINLQALVGGC